MTTPHAKPTFTESPLWAYCMVMVGATAVAFMPNTAKLAYQSGANTETVIFIRALTGVIMLGSYVLLTRTSLRIPKDLLLTGLIASVAGIGSNYGFYASLNYLDVSLTTLIVFIYPMLIAFFFHFNKSARLTPFRLFWGFAAFAGLGLTLSVSFANLSPQGVMLAGGSAVLTSVMLIKMMQLSQGISPVATNFFLALCSVIFFAVLIFSTQTAAFPQTSLGWVSSIGNGVGYIIAYLTFIISAKIIGTARTSMLTSIEPVGAILVAAAIFGETLTLIQWGGVALVTVGLIVMEAPKGTFSKLPWSNKL